MLHEARSGEAQGLFAFLSAGGALSGLDAGLQFALDGLVALSALGVGEVALLLALDVGHGTPLSVEIGVIGEDA